MREDRVEIVRLEKSDNVVNYYKCEYNDAFVVLNHIVTPFHHSSEFVRHFSSHVNAHSP